MTEHKTINSENGTTHYWITRNPNDNAKCIVFTHGINANHLMFEKQVEHFSQDFTVITWDVPSNGQSRPYKKLQYKNVASELHTILQAEGVEKTVLVGMSMGGYVSQKFGILYPSLVLGFVSIDSTPFGHDYYPKFDRWCMRRVDNIAALLPLKLLKMSLSWLDSKTEYAYKTSLKMVLPLEKSEICSQIRFGFSGFLDENQDTHLDFPVLILVGEFDITGKVKKYCKEWSRKEGYPLHVIKGAAHYSNGDKPELVNEEISAFVRTL